VASVDLTIKILEPVSNGVETGAASWALNALSTLSIY
jgi:hypothetical protein